MEKAIREQLLSMLENNSKLTERDIAIMLGLTEDEIHEEIAGLEKAHVICGYHTLIDWNKVNDDDVTALVELRVTPQGGEGYQKLASIEEVQSTTTHFTLTKYKELGVSFEVKQTDERMVVTP